LVISKSFLIVYLIIFRGLSSASSDMTIFNLIYFPYYRIVNYMINATHIIGRKIWHKS